MDYQDSTNAVAAAVDPTAPAADGPVTDAPAPTQTQAFLAELAVAMQVAAGHERERIAASMAEDATAHVERTQTRAAAESEELRRLADEDVDRIAAWSATEIDRIRAEAARRTDERRRDLEDYLRQHDAIITTEVEAVDIAVRDYRATLDGYFDELAGSSDPAEIVARADSLPPPPDLDVVRAAARSGAVSRFAEAPTEPTRADADDAGIGVMDPDAIGATTEPLGEMAVVGPEAEAPTEASADADGAAVSDADGAAVSADTANAADEDAVGEEDDHASPAVRLLRSIAPWTAPNAGSEPHDETHQTH